MTEFKHIPPIGIELSDWKKEIVKEIKRRYLESTGGKIEKPILIGSIFLVWLKDALDIEGDFYNGYSYYIPNFEKDGQRIPVRTSDKILARSILINGTVYDFN